MLYIKHLINGLQAVKPINHDGSHIQTHVQKLHLSFLSDRRELESLGFINIVPWLNHYSTIVSNEPNELTSTLVTKDSNCLSCNTGQIKNAKNVDFKTKHIWDNHERDSKSPSNYSFFWRIDMEYSEYYSIILLLFSIESGRFSSSFWWNDPRWQGKML